MHHGDFMMIELWPILIIPWSEAGLDIVDTGPPAGGSFIELPGPKRYPARPHLEPTMGSGGISARLVRADGELMAVIVSRDEVMTVVPVTESPLALSTRDDGQLWVLNPGRLVCVDLKGQEQHSTDVSGFRLIGGEDDAVWVIGQENAWWVDNNGIVRGEYPWHAGLGSVGSAGTICGLYRDGSTHVRCLAEDGEDQTFPLPSSVGPLEQLVAFANGVAITRAGAKLRHWDHTGLAAEIMIQAAGLTSSGDAFISGRSDGVVDMWLDDGTHRQYRLPSDAPEQGALRAVALDGARTLIYGLDFGAWYQDDHIDRRFVVDEPVYRTEIFPHLWGLASSAHTTSGPDGTVVLSTTGPGGLALIGLRWLPENTR